MDTQQVIDKYFRDNNIMYFQSSDANKSVEGETYLRYEKTGIMVLKITKNLN